MRLLLLFLFIGFYTTAFSTGPLQVKPLAKVAQLSSDSSKVDIRKFNPQQIKAYAARKEFIYIDEAPANESVWSKFWRWFWRSLEKVLVDKHTGPLIKYAAIAAAVALVIYIIFKATGMDLRAITSNSKAVYVPYSESQENIHEIDFSEEINKAVTAGNYRLAVRLFYLRTLKKLNDNGMISWQPEKTNQTYIREIADPEKQQQFIGLTAQFEFIWYGEFFIDIEAFDHVKNAFERFNPKGS